MIITNNASAINAHRHLGISQGMAAKAQEKLASGLRINRARDDAAGLAISEKMRAQIRGLDQASRNAQDGVSMIQTAEGALNEGHSILQRMRELAVQSANHTNEHADRAHIQSEVNSLAQELSRIATATEFNQKKLVDGSAMITLQIGANAGQTISFSLNAMDAISLGVGRIEAQNVHGTTSSTTEVSISYLARLKMDPQQPDHDLIGRFNPYGESGSGYYIGDSLEYATENPEPNGSYIVNWGGHDYEVVLEDETVTTTTHTLNYIDEYGTNQTAIWQNASGGQAAGYYSNDHLIHTAEMAYQDGMSIALAIHETPPNKKEELLGIDVTTSESANLAIGTIDSAISRVSSERSNLGANQSRLEHILSTLTNASENLQSAESRIRDVDIAEEIMTLTKANLLAQASQSMMVQANQSPQQVLNLLN